MSSIAQTLSGGGSTPTGTPPTTTGGGINWGQNLSKLSIGMSLLSGIAGSSQAKANAEYNKQIFDQQAAQVEAQKALSKRQFVNTSRQLQGSIMASTAASGLQFTGSPAESLSQSMTELGIDQGIEQYNLDRQKDYYTKSGQLAQMYGEGQSKKYMMEGATSALTQGADYMEKYWKPKAKTPPKTPQK